MSETAPRDSRALGLIRELVQSGRPLIYLLSPEEGRVALLLQEAAERLFPKPAPVFSWSLTEGMRGPDGNGLGPESAPPRAALDFVTRHSGSAVFHLKDFHQVMRGSVEVCRRLRDVYAQCFDSGKFVFISAPVPYIPEEISREIVLIDVPLPDVEELVAFLQREADTFATAGTTVDTDPGVLGQLAHSLKGLTIDECRHALRRAAAATTRIDSGAVRYLLEEKHLLVKKKSGVIEYITDTISLDQLGGLPYLKRWLVERRKLFQMRDALSADIVPKGILLMGISGCGKSLTVKAVAGCFELPLYRVDMVGIFSGRHGNPEDAFASACRTLEEMAPAVVWFDEIEMGISSRTDDAAGTLGRLFAFFLTWMQEKTRGLFVAATANRIDLLPAEMIRKGRFDEVFFLDLPAEDERVEICKIHLRKRGVDPEPMQLDRLRQFTRGWTGAEIEQCVVSALTTAKLAERGLTADDLLNTTGKIVPLSRTMKEQVETIRAWALDRAVRAAPRIGDRA